MAKTEREVLEWLSKLGEKSRFAIDDKGLAFVEADENGIGTGDYRKVGGTPLKRVMVAGETDYTEPFISEDGSQWKAVASDLEPIPSARLYTLPDCEPLCEVCGGEIGIGGIEGSCADCVEDEE